MKRGFIEIVVTVICGVSVTAALQAATPEQRQSETGMVFVPAGAALLGDNNVDAMPGTKPYNVEPFLIDRFEVTNKDYAVFATKTSRPPAAFFDDDAFNKADQPVTGVTWQDASDYCIWVGKRLPLEVEWEKAARGSRGQTYPWGDTLDLTLAHLSGERPVAVTSHPRDESPFRARGMAGNVSEWVMNRQTVRGGVCGKSRHHGHKTSGKGHMKSENTSGSEAGSTSHENAPARANQVLTQQFATSGTCAFIKGNSWSGRPHMTKLSNRMWDYTDSIAEFVGFRCARPLG